MQIRILLFFVVSSILISSCATQNESVVARYGEFTIPLSEFEHAYAQSVGGVEAAKSDSLSNYKNFLDLYVNFKMKLRDAEVRGFGKDENLAKEYNDYKNSVGESYLIEKEIVNPGILNLYELRKNEVRASHIMLTMRNKPEDEVYNKAVEIINEINNGASFDSLANVYSEDTYTKSKGGDVFYVVAGTVLPELEDAIYSLNVGEVYQKPVKTKFGYHIIKLTDKRKFVPEITVRHILASVRDTNNAVDTLKSLDKIKEVKAKLDAGDSFEKLAKEYSDDKGSAVRGGLLNPFGRRVTVRPFEETAFNLKEGETSGIVKTDFGYHIIQLLGKKEYPSFSEERENLLTQYKQLRYNIDLNKYLEKLKSEFNYKLNTGLISFINSKNDSVKFNATYNESELRNLVKDSVIFSYADKKFIFDSLAVSATALRQTAGQIIKEATILTAVEYAAQKALLKEKVSHLENDDKNFAQLMDDYRNGLYIFKIQEEEIWNKINLDSARVHDHYEKTKNDYVWKDRVDYSEIFINDSSKAFSMFKVIQSGGEFDTVAAKENDRPALKSKNGRIGIVDADMNSISRKAYEIEKPGEVIGPIKNGGGWSIIKLNEKIPSRIKTFEECKAEVMSVFQELESKRLEIEYLDKLSQIYQPVKNYDELENAFGSAQNTNN